MEAPARKYKDCWYRRKGRHGDNQTARILCYRDFAEEAFEEFWKVHGGDDA